MQPRNEIHQSKKFFFRIVYTNYSKKALIYFMYRNYFNHLECCFVQAFQEKNCTLPSHTAPHELLSITTFAENEQSSEMLQSLKQAAQSGEPSPAEKRKAEDTCSVGESSEDDAKRVKKIRLRNSEEDKYQGQNETTASGERMKVNPVNVTSQSEEENIKEETAVEGEKLKKRKRKRRNRSEQLDVADLGLHIMAKKDWKQLRNKYLQLQRNKMKELKQHLRSPRWNQWGSNYDRKDKMDTEEVDKKDLKEKMESSAPKFSFTPGVIVKIEFDEPCSNPKSFKVCINVTFVDLHIHGLF